MCRLRRLHMYTFLSTSSSVIYSQSSSPHVHLGHRIAHLTIITGMANISDTIRFGSLEFHAPALGGTWIPPVFAPLQAFRFESLDFIADQLGVFHLHEEVDTPASPGKVAHIVADEPLNNLNVEALALCIKSVLGVNPTDNDMDTMMYLLINTFS